jgi:hypothetical protein
MLSRATSAPASKCKARLQASALLVGAVLLASPLSPALAQSTSMSAHAASAASREETVDQRISSLHDELKITPAEEADWQTVATTMRDNAAAMEKLASEKAADSSASMTAVADLRTYQQFAEAHVEHLKKLTAAFETLYNSMPESQKKIADQVFSRSHRDDDSGRG